MDADGHPFGKETAVPNHQIQRLPASLMNSLQSKEDVEQFQIHNMEETDVQHDLNYDHIDVKVMCQNGFYQLSCLRVIRNIIFLFLHYVERVDYTVCNMISIKFFFLLSLTHHLLSFVH